MTRYSYNQQVIPPAPFVHVTVRQRLKADGQTDLPALLDSAADISVLPRHLVEALGLVQLDQLPIVGFGGHVTLVP